MKTHVWAEKIDRIVFKIMYGFSLAAGLALVLIAILSTADSLGTTIFSKSLPNGTDWVAYLNIPVVFLSMGFIQVERGNTVVDLLSNNFPKGLRKAVKVFGYLLGMAMCVFLCKCEFSLMMDKLTSGTRSSSAANAFAVWPFAAVIAIGYLLVALAFLWSLFREFLIAPERRMGALPQPAAEGLTEETEMIHQAIAGGDTAGKAQYQTGTKKQEKEEH
ncbi:MAG: TRAP transporter small permease [Parasporobacterium sp.]|nr:TRAP transporter small permease [Parasporobacterium sp.]